MSVDHLEMWFDAGYGSRNRGGIAQSIVVSSRRVSRYSGRVPLMGEPIMFLIAEQIGTVTASNPRREDGAVAVMV